MSIRLGFLDTGSFQTGGYLLNFPQFDVIKQDVSDNLNTTFGKSQFGSFAKIANNKASIKLDFDFLTKTELSQLRSLCFNSRRQLLFMKHPSDEAQILTYAGISNPSSSHKILAIESDSDDLAYGGTELSTANYTLLRTLPNSQSEYYFQQNSKKYSYIFFQFDIGAYSYTSWQRLTLGLYNPFVLDGSTYSGFQIEAWNYSTSTWTPVSKMNFTQPKYTSQTGYNEAYFQYHASLKPGLGFTKISDYVGLFDSNVRFRMRNLFERTGTIQMGFGYPYLLINGFEVTPNENKFNFRSSFTENGYQGTLELQEL